MSKCVQSGFCCTVAPCIYGKAEGDSSSCVYLTEPTRPYGQRFCSKFEEIQELEKESIKTSLQNFMSEDCFKSM